MATQLSDLTRLYPIISSLAEHLTSRDLYAVALTSTANFTNIASPGSTAAFRNLINCTTCDGAGVAARALRMRYFSRTPQTCSEYSRLCDRCMAKTCRNCRVTLGDAYHALPFSSVELEDYDEYHLNSDTDNDFPSTGYSGDDMDDFKVFVCKKCRPPENVHDCTCSPEKLYDKQWICRHCLDKDISKIGRGYSTWWKFRNSRVVSHMRCKEVFVDTDDCQSCGVDITKEWINTYCPYCRGYIENSNIWKMNSEVASGRPHKWIKKYRRRKARYRGDVFSRMWFQEEDGCTDNLSDGVSQTDS